MKRITLFLLVAVFVVVQLGCDNDHKSVPKTLPADAKPFNMGQKGVGGTGPVQERAQ